MTPEQTDLAKLHRLSDLMVRRLRANYGGLPGLFICRYDNTYRALVSRGLLDAGAVLTDLGIAVGRELS